MQVARGVLLQIKRGRNIVGFLLLLFYLATFLVIPITLATKAADRAAWPLLQYLGAYYARVWAAAVVTWVVGMQLPTPDGPPDQKVGQAMGLVFVVFPLLSLVFGVLGLGIVVWWKKRRVP
jgi:hypothetical protein